MFKHAKHPAVTALKRLVWSCLQKRCLWCASSASETKSWIWQRYC